jgi:hypothetical protein
MKRITVHGWGTHYDLTAFKFSAKDDMLLYHAGYGLLPYIALIHWKPEPEIYVDSEKGYAPHATDSTCIVLNAAVHRVLWAFDQLPSECHMEVEYDKTSWKSWNELKVAVTPGLQFK